MKLKKNVTEIEYYQQWMDKYANDADELSKENQRLRGLLERTLGAIEYYGRSHTDFPNLTQDIKKELSDE
jgi:hypothetical protein